jgi:hypothetical protein
MQPQVFPAPMQMQGRPTYNLPNNTAPVIVIPGFETCGPCVPMAYYTQPPQVIQMDFGALSKTAVVTVETAKMLLERWVSQHCCYGSGAAKNSSIECVGVCNSLSIQMDTFIETRHSEVTHVPYHQNEPVMFPQGAGVPPQPWQLQLPAQQFFMDGTTKHEASSLSAGVAIIIFFNRISFFQVPFTSSVQRDHVCGGDGQVRCHQCGGDGKTKCMHCGGDGRVTRNVGEGATEQVSCSNCGGDGQCRCGHCGGDGHVCCHNCRGTGHIRHFVEVTRAHRTLNTFEVLDQINDSELPPVLIKQAGGFQMGSSQYQNIQPPQGIAPDLDAALMRVKERAAQSVIDNRGFQVRQRCM